MDDIDPAGIRLLSESRRSLKSLTGFKKSSRLPGKGETISESYLADVAQADLDSDLDKTFAALRSKFGLKRKEMRTMGPVDGLGAITTPVFTYEVAVEAIADQPHQVLWRRAITAITEAEAVTSDPFAVVFGDDFNTLEINSAISIDVESVIDRVEDADAEGVSVEYDRDATWCRIELSQQKTTIEVHEDSIRVSSRVETSPEKLIDSLFSIHRQFLSEKSPS